MPLLRLQQPRPRRRRRRRAGGGRWSPRSRRRRATVPGRRGRQRLLRRRHPEPDAARDRGRGASRRSRAAGAGRRTPRSRSRPTRPRSRPGASAATATPGSTGCRWGCRRSTTPTCGRSGGCTTSPRRVRAFEVARGDLPAGQLRPDLCPPGPDPRRLAGRARPGAGDGGRPSVALPADHRARHPLRRPRRPRPAARPARRRGSRPTMYRADPGDLRRGRAAGLRDLEPRPARGGEPAQPRLLALRRLCRHRPRRARPADRRRRALGDRGAARARGLARGGRDRTAAAAPRAPRSPRPSRRSRCC